MTSERKELLFSENQVSALVESRIDAWVARKQLSDNPPQTITVTVKTVLAKFREMEADILKKHAQATKAWRKAFALYTEFLKKNPGSKALNEPGGIPRLGSGIEALRARIRAFEVTPETTLKISKTEWTELFKEASLAIADMRRTRDDYNAFTSGATTFLNTSTTLR